MIDLSKPLPSRPAHTTLVNCNLQTPAPVVTPVAIIGNITIKKVTLYDTTGKSTERTGT